MFCVLLFKLLMKTTKMIKLAQFILSIKIKNSKKIFE